MGFDGFYFSADDSIDEIILVRLNRCVGLIVGVNCIRHFVDYFYG